jgi:tRNA U34 5-methylaminomethyl-2-thiouridine-forming methyltransferase MnmC
MTEAPYKIVQLANGTHSVHSVAERETFHPVIGPVAEAEALYVKQLKLPARLVSHSGEFVIWDVGLGAAANVLTVLRSTRALPCSLRILSFDKTLEPLRFALAHPAELDFISGYENRLVPLLASNHVAFSDGPQSVSWELHQGDFPELLRAGAIAAFPAPHVILFDAFSPAKNPAMWTAPLFSDLFRRLDPARPCAMPTYSRSTMLRVTLLLAGFYVGVGHATGEKEETTIAANHVSLLEEPLPPAWLDRVRRSKSAEPMWEPAYRQAPLAASTWETLQRHPQFR